MDDRKDITDEQPLTNSEAPVGARMDRRGFLVTAAGASLGLSGVLFGVTLVQALMPPERSIGGVTTVGARSVARMSDLQLGKPVVAEYGDDSVFVIKVSSREVRVFDAACPHARCTLNFDELTGGFECPCHGSSFTLQGQRIDGPAPRDMVPAQVEIVDDEVIVVRFEA
jgi:Rieske Fe-S protein